jgi:hypothetical protein
MIDRVALLKLLEAVDRHRELALPRGIDGIDVALYRETRSIREGLDVQEEAERKESVINYEEKSDPYDEAWGLDRD